MTEENDGVIDFTGLVISAFFLAGFAVIAGQVFFYLQDGIWHSVSLITVLQQTESKWALSPDSWIGLWNVLDFIPLSIALIAFGIAIGVSD